MFYLNSLFTISCFTIIISIVSIGSSEFIILSQGSYISRINIEHQRKLNKTVSLLNSTYASYIDYDIKNNCVFLTNSHKIIRQCFDDNKPTEVLVSYGIEHISGLAYDWMSKVLYFSDNYGRKIEAVNVSMVDYLTSDRLRRTIVDSAPLYAPANIAVHPKRGYLFWTAWTGWGQNLLNGSIYRTNLDGTNSRRIVGKPKVIKPYGIGFDYDVERVYWIDSELNCIASCDMVGNQLNIVTSYDEKAIIWFGLSIYNNWIYYLEMRSNGLANLLTMDNGKAFLYVIMTCDTDSLYVYLHYIAIPFS